MNEIHTKTIREIALQYPQTTKVFENFKIDYCCGGRKPLAEAAESAGLDINVIEARLDEAINKAKDNGFVPERLGPADLTDHVIAKHHVYTHDALERLAPLMDKVCDRHGEAHKELYLIRSVLRSLTDDLVLHMRKEEMVLFPYIKSISEAASNKDHVPAPHFLTMKNPVRVMMSEHDVAGDFLRQIREFSKDFSLPDGACPSFKALYFGLEELENDLHQHIHLENNVLFPQAIQLEETVLAGTEDGGEPNELMEPEKGL
jgi:regulator of cell morphogenesis and NO signaling